MGVRVLTSLDLWTPISMFVFNALTSWMWNHWKCVLNWMFCLCREILRFPLQEDEHKPFSWAISLPSPQQNLLEDSKRWDLQKKDTLQWLHFKQWWAHYPESEPSLLIPNYGSDYWVWMSLIILDPFQPFNWVVDEWMLKILNFFEQVCFHKTKRGQAALDRLKVFDGIPPPYDKVDYSYCFSFYR